MLTILNWGCSGAFDVSIGGMDSGEGADSSTSSVPWYPSLSRFDSMEVSAMTAAPSDKARALVGRTVIANLAPVDFEGRPQLTPVWIDLDGDDLVFNTANGRTKTTNLTQNSNAAVSIVDRDGPYNVVVVRGSDEGSDLGADEHIDSLAKTYLAVDTYPMRQPGEVRIVYRVHADTVMMQSSDD
jgi:PPOX class probable F420-dependent enzyme